MLYLRKSLCLLFAALLLVQPVLAESVSETSTEPTQLPEPDIISAVHGVETLPTNWNPLSPATPERQWLRKMTTSPMYALSEEGLWQGILARELPEDVTKDYASSYGIPVGATGGYAYRILLNSDARWDDGLIITADDYLFSIKKLLEDEENRNNWTFLANAEAVLSEKNKAGEEIVTLREAGFLNIADAVDAGCSDFYIDTTSFWGLEGGWRPVTDRRGLQDFAMPSGMDERFVSPAYLYNNYLAAGREFSRFQKDFVGIPAMSGDRWSMEDLGIIKISPFELVLILDVPLAPSTLMQNLQNLFLFRQSCWGKDFATSSETYCGYGPYRISAADRQQIILEPNEHWWGSPVSADFDRIICREIGS